MSIMKYIKPKCEVIEMEDIVMNVVSKPTASGAAPDGGNPDDVEAITEAIRTLRDAPERRKAMSKYSLSRHSEYTIQGRAKRILSFINKHI